MHVKFTDYLIYLLVQKCVEALDAEDNSTYLLHLLFIIYLPVCRVLSLSLQNISRVLQILLNFYFSSVLYYLKVFITKTFYE